MSFWKQPPFIKVYEALGAIADDRIKIDGNSAKVYSSSGNKFYTVSYDPAGSSIMCNDNGSYWAGYLGYPAIAYLLKIGVIPFDLSLANLLKDIAWKDINQDFKNDFVNVSSPLEAGNYLKQMRSIHCSNASAPESISISTRR